MGESADKFDDNYGIMMKEIELIQDIIKRMAHNSFLIKGWAITLILTTFLLKSDDLEKGALISLVPLVGFWFLDSFYLSTERNYRKLHEWIIANRKHSLDFCFDLSLKKVEKKDVTSTSKTQQEKLNTKKNEDDIILKDNNQVKKLKESHRDDIVNDLK